MNAAALRKRWSSDQGRRLGAAAVRWLSGGDRPTELGEVDGRADLRGLAVTDLSLGQEEVVGGVAVRVVDGLLEIHGGRWQAIDLSDSRIPGLRLFDTQVQDCVFDGAAGRDWRLWNTSVENCRFVGADLRDSALGTWHGGKANTWHEVVFDAADLRQVQFFAGTISRCSFMRTRLDGAQFLHVGIEDTTFTGSMRNILFEGRELPDRPVAGPMRNVDLAGARFDDVEFRGYRFEGVRIPDAPGYRLIRKHPVVVRRALELLASSAEPDAELVAAILADDLVLPGADDSVSVFNRADFEEAGGERVAALTESVLVEAQREVG